VTRFSTYVAPPWVRFGFVAVWALVLLYATVSDPSGAALSRTGPFGALGLDKWLHAVGYAAFAVLVAYAFLPRWRGTHRGLIATLLLAGGYGLAMEVVQGPLAYRSFDPADAVANVLGALVVVLAVGLVSRVLEWRSRRSRPEPGRGR
jgi:VanZ family protein